MIFSNKTDMGLVLAIGLAAYFSAKLIPNLDALTLSLLFGILIRNFLNFKISGQIEKHALALGIALLGCTFSYDKLALIGGQVYLKFIILIALTFVICYLISKIFKLDKNLSLLTAAGMGICGSSAIVAASGVIKADKKYIGLSIAAVNLVGIIGLFVLPIIIKFFNLDFENSAELIGGSLPAVGQVVAAGAMLDEKLAESAMVMKLARISLIIPVLLILSIIFNKTNNENKFSFNILPWYLYGFVILFLISQIAVFQAPALFLSSLIKPLFVIAMAAIGLSIGFKDLFKIGPKAFGLALFIFAFQIVFLIVV